MRECRGDSISLSLCMSCHHHRRREKEGEALPSFLFRSFSFSLFRSRASPDRPRPPPLSLRRARTNGSHLSGGGCLHPSSAGPRAYGRPRPRPPARRRRNRRPCLSARAQRPAEAVCCGRAEGKRRRRRRRRRRRAGGRYAVGFLTRSMRGGMTRGRGRHPTTSALPISGHPKINFTVVREGGREGEGRRTRGDRARCLPSCFTRARAYVSRVKPQDLQQWTARPTRPRAHFRPQGSESCKDGHLKFRLTTSPQYRAAAAAAEAERTAMLEQSLLKGAHSNNGGRAREDPYE